MQLRSNIGDFENITEVDDIWFLYSQKGRQGLKYSRNRGGTSVGAIMISKLSSWLHQTGTTPMICQLSE